MLGWIRTARGVFVFLFWGGLVLIGGGAGLALADHVWLGLIVTAFGAGVMWAIGYWIVPFAEPAKYRRLIRAWSDWSRRVMLGQDTARRRAKEIYAQVQALPVPSRFAAEAPSVVAQFQPDLSKAGRDQLERRMRESAARLRAAHESASRWEREVLTSEERDYASALREALDERLDATAQKYENARIACEEFGSFLAEAKASGRHIQLQKQMKAAVKNYAAVMETGRDAASTRDYDSLSEVGAQLAAAAAEMQSVRENLLAASPVRRKQTQLRPSGG